jgi:hypothetical protein
VNPITRTLALAAASANNIALSQAGPTGAGNLTLNGSTVTGGVATLDAARRVLFTPAGAEATNGTIWTIYGTNRSGAAIQEAVTGVNNPATVGTSQDFKTVTRIAVNKTQAGNVTVGTSAVGSTNWVMLNNATTPMNAGVNVTVSGVITYTVEYTYQDPNTLTTLGTFPTVFSLATMTGQTGTLDSTFTTPVWGIRATQTAFTNPGNLTLTVLQAGIG